MSFELIPRIIAVDGETVANFYTVYTDNYGEYLPTGDMTTSIKTIGAYWDDTAQTRLRAVNVANGDIVGIKLKDGRVAFTCLWQSNLAAAFDAGQLQGNIQQLSINELTALTPQPPAILD